MTRGKAIEVLKDLWRYEHSEFSEKDIREALDIAINSLEIDERYELEYEQAEPRSDVLDKIRTEIQKIYIGYRNGYEIMADVLQIIDAYQTESEDEE